MPRTSSIIIKNKRLGWKTVGERDGAQHKCKNATWERMRRKLEERKTANATNKRK